MEIEIKNFIKTRNKKKINRVIDMINKKHLFPISQLLEESRIRTLESFGIEYIAQNNNWNYDTLYITSINISLIENNLKKMLKKIKPFSISKNLKLSFETNQGLYTLNKYNSNKEIVSIFSLDSNNIQKDVINFIQKKIGENINKGIPINFFNLFIVLKENQKVRVLNKLEGIRWINEK